MILPAVVLALLFWNLPGRAGHGGEKAHRGHPAAVSALLSMVSTPTIMPGTRGKSTGEER